MGADGGGHELCLTSEGDVPLREILACLQAGGYDGCLTLEWEKMWVPALPEPEVAFSAYAAFMRRILAEIRSRQEARKG